jgi:hypothetical protein
MNGYHSLLLLCFVCLPVLTVSEVTCKFYLYIHQYIVHQRYIYHTCSLVGVSVVGTVLFIYERSALYKERRD